MTVTLMPAELLTALSSQRLIAILRGSDPDAVVRSAQILVDAGINLLEVSLTSASPLRCIEILAERLAGSDAILGAGTVLAPGDAARCRDAGAAFNVTPTLGAGVSESVALGLPVLAGALTPSEVTAAHSAGATAVKVFPASVFGPSYLRALHAPLPEIPLVAVGGVNADHVPSYLMAGAVAVGVASPLVGDAADGGDLDALAARARAFLQVVDAHA